VPYRFPLDLRWLGEPFIGRWSWHWTHSLPAPAACTLGSAPSAATCDFASATHSGVRKRFLSPAPSWLSLACKGFGQPPRNFCRLFGLPDGAARSLVKHVLGFTDNQGNLRMLPRPPTSETQTLPVLSGSDWRRWRAASEETAPELFGAAGEGRAAPFPPALCRV
jgi:hypothetical protein